MALAKRYERMTLNTERKRVKKKKKKKQGISAVVN